MTTFVYTNKATNAPGTRPEEWIQNIADINEKLRVSAIFNIESERFLNGDAGEPSADFDAAFAQYCAECNIEPSRSE
jgi:hypothetical protein